MKKIWRKNFEIQRVEYIMMSEAIESFFKFQKPSVKRNYLKKNQNTYVLREFTPAQRI